MSNLIQMAATAGLASIGALGVVQFQNWLHAREEGDFEFHNWAGNLTCRPKHFYQPASEEEVVRIVQEAQGTGQVIRVVGAGHSWSPLVLTDDILLNLDHLRQVVRVDPDKYQVTVQAGIRLKNLVVELMKAGLAMRNLGAIMEQSIAGAISTGTHGSGLLLGSLHTQIIGMKLVTGTGEVLEISEEKDPALMSAARVSLGALGVITEVTIQCVPAYNLELKAWVAPFEEVLGQLDTLVRQNDRVRLYWLPGSDKVYVNSMDHTDKPVTQQSPIIPWFRNIILRHYVLGVLWEAGHALPDLVEVINKFEADTGFTDVDEIGPAYKELTTSVPPIHIECEYALPMKNAVKAIRLHRQLIEERGFHVNVPSEIRFVAGDENMLSPARDRETCYIGAYTSAEDFTEGYYDAFEQEMKPLGGRPHWGKQFTLTRDEVKALYPQYDAFNKIRKQLDPEGLFANRMIRELFD